MRRGTLTLLFLIILLAVGASFVVFWPNPGTTADGKPVPWHGINNPFTISKGLDLAGGVHVVLAPKTGNPSDEDMQNTMNVLTSRISGGLGVKDASIRLLTSSGQKSIAIDLPSIAGDEQSAITQLLTTGTLEFWDTGTSTLQAGTTVDPTQYKQTNGGIAPLFTGKDLDANNLSVGTDQSGTGYAIDFAMQGNAVTRLTDFTSKHVGDAMTITLDKKVVTSATIQTTLPGTGQITGRFTQQQASQIVQLLKYGALPVTLTTLSQGLVSATLGDDAIHRSLLAGGIGLAIVILFMLLYYRLPGFLADIALILYAIFSFAIFKLIGVSMTLAGIAGFILSIGMAVDANVLIFERVKEELRDGRLLSSAIDIGWRRAWPSIRDSNTSTLITCAVLYTFGSNFSATIIVGFATTLFLGVVVSMFTAIVVTRTFLNLLVPTGVINHPALFGLPASAIPMSSRLARRNSTV